MTGVLQTLLGMMIPKNDYIFPDLVQGKSARESLKVLETTMVSRGFTSKSIHRVGEIAILLGPSS
jgi:hypothetical protein